MRKVEEVGKKFKRTGYFQGTAMWKWRNVIGGTIMGFAITVDVAWMWYWYNRRDEIRKDMPIFQERNDLDPFEARRLDLQNRKEKLLGKTKEIKDIFANLFK